MHLARSVLESTQRNNAGFDNEESQPRSWPSQSSGDPDPRNESRVAGAALPSIETAANLIDIFFSQYQIQYPILLQDEFMTAVSDFYGRSGRNPQASDDPTTHFMLNMVLSISLVYLSRESPETMALARSFSSTAMTQLSTIMRVKNHQTLQCLLLLLLSSILNSMSAPVWYISGLSVRMCVALGFHSEKTIRLSGRRAGTDDEVDTKRRLFWVTYTFDRTLATMLGRPFTLEDDKIDVLFPNKCLPTSRKAQFLHWLKLQRLQSEIVHRLYTTKENQDQSSKEQSDLSNWTAAMTQKLLAWNEEAAGLAEPGACDLDWWRYWYHNAMLILHRPLPNNPRPPDKAVSTAYESAKNMIHLSFIRISKSSPDFTWLDIHCQLMSGITLLFLVLKSPEARSKARNDWTSFKSCLVEWQFAMEQLTSRWERLARMRSVLTRLADATVDIVEKEMMQGRVSRPTAHRLSSNLSRERRRSIMQQLGSPKDLQQEGSSHDRQVGGSSIRQELASILPMTQKDDVFGSAVYSGDVSSGQRITAAPESFNARPSQSPNQPEEQSRSPSYTAAQPYYQPQQTIDQTGFFDPPDLSTMLDSDLWSGLDSYDTMPTQSNFGLFDYFPIPMTGSETFGLGMGALGSRPDAMLTDSVLNFHSTMDDGPNDLQGSDTGC